MADFTPEELAATRIEAIDTLNAVLDHFRERGMFFHLKGSNIMVSYQPSKKVKKQIGDQYNESNKGD